MEARRGIGRSRDQQGFGRYGAGRGSGSGSGSPSDGRADGRTDGRTDGRADGRTGERLDGRTDGQTDGRMDGRTDARTVGRTVAIFAFHTCFIGCFAWFDNCSSVFASFLHKLPFLRVIRVLFGYSLGLIIFRLFSRHFCPSCHFCVSYVFYRGIRLV